MSSGTRIETLVSAVRQAAGAAGNCARGNLLAEAADAVDAWRREAAMWRGFHEKGAADREDLRHRVAELQAALDAADLSRVVAVVTAGGVAHLYEDPDEARAVVASRDWGCAAWVDAVEVHRKR